MTWSQSLVVSWLQFAVAAAVLLAAARVAMRWIVQPAERIRLIQFILAAAVAVPLLMAFVPLPAWRLELLPGGSRSAATSEERARHEAKVVSVAAVDMPVPAEGSGPSGLPLDEPVVSELTDARPAPAADSLAPAAAPGSKSAAAALDAWLITAILIFLAHAVAGLFFGVEWAIGRRRLSRLVRSAATPLPSIMGIWKEVARERGRRVRLLLSNQVASPLAFGWRRPVVVIPHSVAAEGGQLLRWCLAHEWSHIERGDILAWHATWFCQFVLWHQPLFWSLRRELRVCQDNPGR